MGFRDLFKSDADRLREADALRDGPPEVAPSPTTTPGDDDDWNGEEDEAIVAPRIARVRVVLDALQREWGGKIKVDHDIRHVELRFQRGGRAGRIDVSYGWGTMSVELKLHNRRGRLELMSMGYGDEDFSDPDDDGPLEEPEADDPWTLDNPMVARTVLGSLSVMDFQRDADTMVEVARGLPPGHLEAISAALKTAHVNSYAVRSSVIEASFLDDFPELKQPETALRTLVKIMGETAEIFERPAG